MIYSEKQYKELKEKYIKLKKENDLKDKEVKLLKKQNKQKDEIIYDLDKNNYRSECETLRIEIKELKKKLQIYEEKFELARISLKKDSSNSCKPSSTNGYKKVIQNNRVKSGKKPGRENGHKKSSPEVSVNPDKVVRVSKVATCKCGSKTIEKEEVIRELVSMQVITYRTHYIGKKTECPCCKKEYMPKFPNNVKQTVTYDEKIKSILVYLNAHCNVPNQKSSDFVGFLSDEKIKLAPATVLNTIGQFNKKSQPILKQIKEAILKAPVINEDETPISVNGKIMSTIGVFTDKISYMDAFENRKLESFVEMGILDRYIGTVCHDHNKIHESFVQTEDAECNFHILRYCKAEYEIHKWESIKNFMNYMLELRDTVDKYKIEGRTSFSQEEYEIAKKEYLKRLDEWDKQHMEEADKNKPQYYNEERCLKTRLRAYVDDHLRFLTDFRINFTNNLAERGLRPIKKKLKMAGTFRSLKSAKWYCGAMNIIDTCIKNGLNVGRTIEKIFRGKKKIFKFA